jgi:uncharacterized protein (DUF58 family)
LSRLTPEELREVRRLHVHAGRKVDSLFSGDWRSAFRGRGMEFEEVREYSPGDDVRHIDWNVTARTGEPFIKVFREERQLTVVLAVDVSGSTHVGTGGRDGRTDKRLQSARIAAGLAYAGIRNRDKVGLLTFTDRVEHFIAPRGSRGHVWNIITHAYDASAASRKTDLAEGLSFLAKTQRRKAVVVVVSDFLDTGKWDRVLGTLAARHTVHAMLVHDRLDEGLGRLGLLEVVDAETGELRVLHGRTARGMTVDERMTRLKRCGARAVAISTEDDAFKAMHRHFARSGGRR